MAQECDVVGTLLMPDGSPASYDGLLNSGFRLSFIKLPWMSMFLQAATVPSVSVTEVKFPTRYADINEIGEKMSYGDFNCTFMVDKNMKNYKEIFNWMRRMTVAGTAINEVDNPVLIINNKETFRFVGAWPSSVSNLNFVSNVSEPTYLTADVSFNFDYMEFVESPFHETNP
jgi:hypothetical protein